MEGGTALGWLAELELATDRLEGALALPSPLPDGALGGGPGLDLYLSPGGEELEVFADAPEAPRRTDAASAFCTAGAGLVPADRAATFCVAEAILIGLDASETPFTRRALAEELWLVAGEPTSVDLLRFDDFQAHPERALAARDPAPFSEGASLFFDFLGRARGHSAPAQVAVATYALSGRGTSPPGFRYTNEPDTFDVLRATFGPKPSDFARLLGDFAVARALLGTRDGDATWPELGWVGDLGRVRFEWSVPFSSLPRNLAPSRPVEPTGATYVWVAFDEDPGSSVIAFQAECESPVSFKWVIAVVGQDGRVLRRNDVPYVERETRVERTVSDLKGAAGLLIAGTNLGGLGPSYPFDPDFEPFEPHGYQVYLAVP